MSKKTKKRKMKVQTKLRLMQAGGILATFLPLAVAVFIHREQYFATKAATIGLTSGGVIAAVIVTLAVLGKGRKLFGSGVAVSGIIFAMTVLLEPILLNLQYLTGMLLIGELVNAAIFAPQVRRLKKKVEKAETAQALKEAMYE